MLNDFRGKAVLITGGTMGIGLETGLSFGRQGAICTLTNRWGTADEDEIFRAFEAAGAPRPFIATADVSNADDTQALIEELRSRHESIEVFVSNVAFASSVRDVDDYQLRALLKGIEYSAWPLVSHTLKIRSIFGRPPRYVVGLSSNGVDGFLPNYDLVGAAKAVLEQLCRNLTQRFFDEDVRINIVRARPVDTASMRAIFGEDFVGFCKKFDMPGMLVTAREVADFVLALCSGLMDAVRGQILMVDNGATFCDNTMRLHAEKLLPNSPINAEKPSREEPSS